MKVPHIKHGQQLLGITMKHLRKELTELRAKIDLTFDSTVNLIDIYGVALDDALKNQLLIQLEWEIVSKKSRSLHALCEIKVDEMYSIAFKNEAANSQKALTITEIKEYAKTNPDYISSRYLLAEATELKEEAAGLLDVVTTRKYVLNSLTNAIIASCNKEIL